MGLTENTEFKMYLIKMYLICTKIQNVRKKNEEQDKKQIT